MTIPGFILDALSPEVTRGPKGGINRSARWTLWTRRGQGDGIYFLLGMDTLPERRMVDNAVTATIISGDAVAVLWPNRS